ncbi:MAG TPA: hypothetical protein VGD83_03865, partial [Streptosporangiaceae bacterium]
MRSCADPGGHARFPTRCALTRRLRCHTRAQAGAASAATTGRDGHHKILYVSRHAWPWGADRSCRSARFRTIQSAVNAVRPGGTVVVCPGTYHEQVVI